MTSRPNEKQTCVHSEIDFALPLGLLFLPHIQLMLIINKVNNRGPRISVVDIVAETRRVDHRELDFERLFFELSLDDLNLDTQR